MATEFGPCEPWPVRWPCELDETSIALTGTALEVATETIWALSGRQFGTCTVKLRPCRKDCADAPWPNAFWDWTWPGTSWVTPALVEGQWYNITCGVCSGTCTCSTLSEVELPWIVNEIIEVKLDGSVMPTGSYRVDDHRLLVRTDGGQWPWCNDLNHDDDQPDTWSVTASYGREVPEGGEWAVGELACELIKAMKGEDCRLPRNISQLARQGVTISYPDINNLFDRGRTGLYLVDLFLTTWNPSSLRNRSRTYKVDGKYPRRTDT